MQNSRHKSENPLRISRYIAKSNPCEKLFGIAEPAEEADRAAIALEAEALIGLFAGHSGIGNMAEWFAHIHIGQMHLHGGQAHGLERVENRNGGMRVGRGIDDDAVKYAERSLDPIDEHTLVVRLADLMDYTPVRGCMAIKPYGYGIWELIQQQLDAEFKRTGHQNVSMPMLIPEQAATCQLCPGAARL